MLDGQRAALEGARRAVGVGRRGEEVAAEHDEHAERRRSPCAVIVVDGVDAGRRAAARSRTCAPSASRNGAAGRWSMPIVRSPCTLEWPRTGHRPAPGRPMLPRRSMKLTISWIVRTACLCCVRPIAQHAMTALRRRRRARRSRGSSPRRRRSARRSSAHGVASAWSRQAAKPSVCSARNIRSTTSRATR